MIVQKHLGRFGIYSSNNQDWSHSSYKFIHTTNTCEEFWGVYKR